ncbi:hypothetical protein E4T42_04999 [Aureobasidium subglaciale]|nr:hypothetical protein E4T42_04999 [Aureobasidium subglaciale]
MVEHLYSTLIPRDLVTSTILITARELRWLTTPHPCPKLHHTRPLSMVRAWQQQAEARQVNIPYRHNQHKESRKTASRCHHFGSRMVLALRQLAVIVTVFRTLGDWANMLVHQVIAKSPKADNSLLNDGLIGDSGIYLDHTAHCVHSTV